MTAWVVFGTFLGAFGVAMLVGSRRRRKTRAVVAGVRAVRRKRRTLERQAKIKAKAGKPMLSTRGTVHRSTGRGNRMVCGVTLKNAKPAMGGGTRCPRCWAGTR